MKPLRTLLDSCSVPIVSAFGDPEIANMPDLEGARTGTFVFFFISRNEIRNQKDGWNQNRHLLISVVDPQSRYGRYPQLPESKEWNNTLAKIYEDMIVLRIYFRDVVKKNQINQSEPHSLTTPSPSKYCMRYAPTDPKDDPAIDSPVFRKY